MQISSKARIAVAAAVLLMVAFAGGRVGDRILKRYATNRACCDLPRFTSVVLGTKEVFRLVSFPSQIGQDKWVSLKVFPGVTDGFFVDVGSGDGVEHSNSVVLERKGWKGICIDPFPTRMEGRTCQVFKDVVYDVSGKTVAFHTAGELGGVAETLDSHKKLAGTFPTVEFTTVTLADILERAKAPPYIHFMSLDIEGAELLALKGLPFDKYRFGAFAIEHNFETEKRNDIQKLLEHHGYRRVHSFMQDDFYLPAGAR